MVKKSIRQTEKYVVGANKDTAAGIRRGSICGLARSKKSVVNEYKQMHDEIEKRRELMRKTYYSVDESHTAKSSKVWRDYFRKKESVF